MKKLILGLVVATLFLGCMKTERPDRYTRSIVYELQQTSEYEYTGELVVGELPSGELELVITLKGEKGSTAVNYPAHLHYEPYGNPDAAMAAMLNPVRASNLVSATILNELGNGTPINYDSFQNFNGHVKVHLASEGPDYEVILVAGNVGANATGS
ncbi:hypothetical protein [Algoriphagus machipongonensis]|uniref:Osteoblast specific factor 2-related protein n=1 Tax=Algoriphagus machipongonensis TaxID=388413 RepID=A3HRV5_9BACT|nr:hypothetical protein [Algoriphagus machipongonensis]EAZ82573.1 osteoblast specific factor 2-related protein [Algoriphagus machipongonensis]